MSKAKTISIRVRYCQCNEVGISDDGIIMWLLRKWWPQYKLVEKCTHWETASITLPVSSDEKGSAPKEQQEEDGDD